MVHPTHSLSVLRRSIRKFVIDNLRTAHSLRVFFDFSFDEPEEDSWVVVKAEDLDIDTLAENFVVFYMFVKNDMSGKNLAELRDIVYDCLVYLDMTDGRARFPLYESDWTEVGHVVISIVTERGKQSGEFGTNYQWIQVKLNWGAK